MLLILIGNIKINTKHIYGSYVPNKSNLLKIKPCKKTNNTNLMIIEKYKLFIDFLFLAAQFHS